ncbi:hypothetical protein ACFL6N_05870, partial [Thermodesulfobacteriota bacterium]
VTNIHSEATRQQLEDFVSEQLAEEEEKEKVTDSKDTSIDRQPHPGSPYIDQDDDAVKDCPETPLYRVTIKSKHLGIRKSDVSMVRSIDPEANARYQKNKTVPLKDFSQLLRSLSGQFHGDLSSLKDSVLKTISLPVIYPLGPELPDKPPRNASTLLVIGNGQRHGIILCTDVAEKLQTMIKFQKVSQGDISAIAHLKEGEELPLVNAVSLLKRDGMLVSAT